jgi:hypothetical protein
MFVGPDKVILGVLDSRLGTTATRSQLVEKFILILLEVGTSTGHWNAQVIELLGFPFRVFPQVIVFDVGFGMQVVPTSR